jgi:hypothetical protein
MSDAKNGGDIAVELFSFSCCQLPYVKLLLYIHKYAPVSVGSVRRVACGCGTRSALVEAATAHPRCTPYTAHSREGKDGVTGVYGETDMVMLVLESVITSISWSDISRELHLSAATKRET